MWPVAAQPEDCPEGSVMLAKFEDFDNGTWTCENGSSYDECDNITLVTQLDEDGEVSNGTWESDYYLVQYVFIKGGLCNHTYSDGTNFTSSGVFNNTDVGCKAGNGQIPAVSHITFCSSQSPPPVPELPLVVLTSTGLLAVLLLYRRME